MGLFDNNKKKDFKEYREILTKEEAKMFQDNIYGNYCSEYNNNVNLMKKYKYRQQFADIPIEVYLGNMFYPINGYLRGIYSPSDSELAVYNMLIDRINETIMCAPKLQENIVVYRAVDDNAIKQIRSQLEENEGKYMEKAFMSTSLLYETVLEEFPSRFDILKIYVPKGAYVLGVDGIKDRNENEMLFCEEQWLKFITKYRDKYNKRNIYEFELFNYSA